MPTHASAKELLDEAEKELNICLDLVEEGKDFSIEKFDEHVRNFCETIAKMPREEMQLYESSLLGLSEAVKSLEEYMIKKRDSIKDSLQSLGNQKKGQSAYKKGDFSDGYN